MESIPLEEPPEDIESVSDTDIDDAFNAPLCSEKERIFAQEYVKDFSGSLAVLRAGCFMVAHRQSAKVIAWRLLHRAPVVAYIDRLKAQRNERLRVTQEKVLQEMALLAHSDISHYVVDDNGLIQLAAGAPDEAIRAISQVRHKKTIKEDKDGNTEVTHEVTIRLWDKLVPLTKLGKHVGLFPDRVELTGANGSPLVQKVERVIVDPLGLPAAEERPVLEGEKVEEP